MKREAEPDVALAIEMTVLCEKFHTLPKPGGLFDQDALHVYMMRAVTLAQQEKLEAEGKRGPK